MVPNPANCLFVSAPIGLCVALLEWMEAKAINYWPFIAGGKLSKLKQNRVIKAFLIK